MVLNDSSRGRDPVPERHQALRGFVNTRTEYLLDAGVVEPAKRLRLPFKTASTPIVT